MDNEFTDEEIVNMAHLCVKNACDKCPLLRSTKCRYYLARYIVDTKENEPAPAVTNTNSNDKTLQIDDRTLLRIYQEELHNISDIITKTDYGVDYILGSIRTALYIIEKLKAGDSNESQPTADVQEVKHGKWIFHEHTKLVPTNKLGIKEEYTNGHDCTVVDNTNVNKKIMIMKKRITLKIPICSVCGWRGYDEYNATPYCPNCGTRMGR